MHKQLKSINDQIFLEYAGLGQDFDLSELVNPISETLKGGGDPVLNILRMMRNPDNFYYTCRTIFNGPNGKPLELPPFQCVVLKELWTRPFPMLTCSRGFSKSFLLGLYALLRALFIPGRRIVITGSGFRQAKTVFNYAETIWHNSPMLQGMVSENSQSGPHHDADRWTLRLGDSIITAIPIGDGCLVGNTTVLYDDCFGKISRFASSSVTPTPNMTVYGDGSFRTTDESYNNGVKPTRKITTRRGYSFEATHNHRMRMLVDGSPVMVDTSAMFVGDTLLIDRSRRWHRGTERIGGKDAYSMGLSAGITKIHDIPEDILCSPREFTASYLSGLFDTFGFVEVSNNGKWKRVTVGITHNSEELIDTLLSLFLCWGIICTKTYDGGFTLKINDINAHKFASEIGFRVSRKQELLQKAVKKHSRDFSRYDFIPGVKGRMIEIAGKYHPVISRKQLRIRTYYLKRVKEITHKVAKLFCDLYEPHVELPEEKLFLSDLRQLSNPDIYYDTIVSIEERENETFDIHVPDGHIYTANGFFSHNTKIRGERAHDILADEFSTIQPDIFERVISGFSVVELDPVDKMKDRARIRVLKRHGVWTKEMEEENRMGSLSNQTIISGTAFYTFNHFYTYWKRWSDIVRSRGDQRKLREALGGEVPEKFDWRDYSVIRVPVDMLPEGFMDDKQIARAKATQHSGTYNCEYGAVFSGDSNGFFKRSLIESCVTTKPIEIDGVPIQFRASTRGNLRAHYIFGIDPASESDNFAIVILEVYPNHRRVVYCWTTTRQDFKARVERKLTHQTEYYGFCARKIRELMRVFPCEIISMDSQGGGRTGVAEALHDLDKLEPGDRPIWSVMSDHPLSHQNDNDEDNQSGLHILELVNFADYSYTSEANDGLRKDLEDRVLLFPEYDPALLAIAMEDDSRAGRIYDTLEDAVQEVEEIKEELATITASSAPISNRLRWDTPELKTPGSRKGRLRKDRYSALLMANSAARRLNRLVETMVTPPWGGFTTNRNAFPVPMRDSKMYSSGPEWFTNPLDGDSDMYGWVRKIN